MRLLLVLSPFIYSFGLTKALSGNSDLDVQSIARDYTSTCKAIKNVVSGASGVYYPGHPLYTKGNSHWASSSNQISACVVEPANAVDVSAILKLVANTSTPFGIRSGGHTTNPGFSSTPGVQIALFKLSQVEYHSAPLATDGSVGTVDIGAGLVWDDVYAALQPHGVTVAGGRLTGVGVGGFTLGGGYSWISNQHGLTIDTVTAFEVVLPNGVITTVTKTSNPDLFFGLKGGFNNFGIVTKFTLLAFPQGKIWGGTRIFTSDKFSLLNAATQDFAENETDPKAQIYIIYGITLGQSLASMTMFYDGPTPPDGIFTRFTSIPSLTSDLSTRSMVSLVQTSLSNVTYGLRSSFNVVSLKTYSQSLLAQIQNQTMYWATRGALRGSALTSYTVEPFLSSMAAKSQGGAFPHDNYLSPMNLGFVWLGAHNDEFFIDALKESARVIRDQAIAEGQDIAGAKEIKYGNYAAANEDLRLIYGSNLDRLRQIKKQYDPDNIMQLAGGYRF